MKHFYYCKICHKEFDGKHPERLAKIHVRGRHNREKTKGFIACGGWDSHNQSG